MSISKDLANDPNEYVTVELSQSNCLIQVKRKRIMLLEKYKKLNGKSNGGVKKRDIKSDSKKKLEWISEGIVVRVISDKYMDGKMYNKKLLIKTILNDT